MIVGESLLVRFCWIAVTLAPCALSHTPTPDEFRLMKRNLAKPVINSNFYDTLLDDGLLDTLNKTTYTISKWDNNLIPSGCKSLIEDQEFQGQQLSAADVEVFNITYPDCDQPWVFCRHKDANATQDTMAEIFGRLPVRMRSYLRHMAAVPGVASAASINQNTVLIGPAANTITVYGHEIGHSLDDHAFGVSSGFSSSQPWLSAYNSDTAVCQAYAQTSQQENLAQMINIALYDQNAPGGIGNLCPIWEEFGNMLGAINTHIGQTLKVGGTCQNRPQEDDLVRKTQDGAGPVTLSNGDVVITTIGVPGQSTGGSTTTTTTTTTTSSVTSEAGTTGAAVETFGVSTGTGLPSKGAAPGGSGGGNGRGQVERLVYACLSVLFWL